MNWKDNKLVGVLGVIVVLGCIGIMVIPRILATQREKKRQEEIKKTPEYIEWKRYEDEALDKYNR